MPKEKNKTKSDVEKEYGELMKKGEASHPGINDLMELYGRYQTGLMQSQKYLQLFHPKLSSLTTNNSSPQN